MRAPRVEAAHAPHGRAVFARRCALGILLACYSAGPLLAAPEMCIARGDNTVTLTGVVKKSEIPSRRTGYFRGFTYVPFVTRARTEFWLEVAQPFRIRVPGQPDCGQDSEPRTSIQLSNAWWPLATGRAFRVTGVVTDAWGLSFLPGRACSVDGESACVDLDDNSRVVGAWTPPRP